MSSLSGLQYRVCIRVTIGLVTAHIIGVDVHWSPHRVSSVLNRDVRQFGKSFMFDGDDETCWNSDQVHVAQ